MNMPVVPGLLAASWMVMVCPNCPVPSMSVGIKSVVPTAGYGKVSSRSVSSNTTRSPLRGLTLVSSTSIWTLESSSQLASAETTSMLQSSIQNGTSTIAIDLHKSGSGFALHDKLSL